MLFAVCDSAGKRQRKHGKGKGKGMRKSEPLQIPNRRASII